MSIGEAIKKLRHEFVSAIDEEGLSGEDHRSAISAFDRARGDVLGDLLDGTNGTTAAPPAKARKPRGPNKPKPATPSE